MLRILLIILGVTSFACCESCPAICAAQLRSTLKSVTGDSGDGGAPLHHLIRTEKNSQVVLQKTKWACYGISRFETCLSSCSASLSKTALMSSLAPWNLFCSIVRKPGRATIDYFTCEREQLKKVDQACGLLSLPNNRDFRVLCKKIEDYRRCYSSQPHNCSAEAIKIKRRVDEALMETSEELVRLQTGNVPSTCTKWRENYLKEHEWKTDDEEEGEASGNDAIVASEDTTTLVITTTTTLPLKLLYRLEKEATTGGTPNPKPRWAGDVPSTTVMPTTREMIFYDPDKLINSSFQNRYIAICILFMLYINLL